MGNYRQAFIKEHPGKKRIGKKGLWYRCASCGKWCGRAGSDKVNIPEDQRMEVDHIKPWSMGGSDEVWNLQPLCRPCNRSKSNSTSVKDGIKIGINTVLHPGDALISVGRKAARNNKILKGLGITKRK